MLLFITEEDESNTGRVVAGVVVAGIIFIGIVIASVLGVRKLYRMRQEGMVDSSL